jgi:hypothetical protein
VLAGAVIGVMMAVFLPERLEAEDDAGAAIDSTLGPDAVSRID